jgi:hypothetical protein
MPGNFYTAAGNPTTTARELSMELSRFAEDLKQTADELRGELSEMKQAKTDITEELSHTAKTFSENTLTELEGDDFDTIAEIAQNVEELSSQSLSYVRRDMTTERDRALQTINETLDEAVDAEGFQQALADAREASGNARQKAAAAQNELEEAKSALLQWEETSTEDDLVRLNDAIAKTGGIDLAQDNRSFYEARLLVSTWRYITNSSYRKVRHALDEYGHGQDGKDAFADLPNFKDKYDTFNAAIENAQATYDQAIEEQQTANAKVDTFRQAGNVKTDEQILEALQEKVANDLVSCPAFITAMAKHYAEDFPRNLALLVAKKDTLEKLEKGTQDKLSQAQTNYSQITDQYSKMSRLRPHTKIKGDLDKIKKRNRASSASYKRYRHAARNGWTRTRDYDWDYNNGTRTVYVDTGPSYFETMLIYNMMFDHDHHHHHYHHGNEQGQFYADENASFSADLMGVDKEAGEAMGLPGETFELSEAAAAEFNDIGVDDDFEPGNMFGVDDAENDPFETVEDNEDSPWGNSENNDNSSPWEKGDDEFDLDDTSDQDAFDQDDDSSFNSGGSSFDSFDHS